MGFENQKIASSPQKKPEQGPEREIVDPNQTPWEQIARLTRNRSRAIDEDVIIRMKKKYPDFNFDRLKPEIERLEHGNLDINFVGVYHTVETLAAHRKAIEAAIAEADIVVLEAAINTSGAAIGSGVSYESSFPVHGTNQSTSLHMPKYELDTNSAIAFFFETENMARLHKKQIVLFDPLSDQRFLQSVPRARLQGGVTHSERLDQLNKKILRYSEAASTAGQTLGYGILAKATAETAWRGAIKPILDKGDTSSEQKKQDRRQFLKSGVGYAAGIGLSVGMMETAEKNRKVINYEGDLGQDKLAQYNESDFRDVSIATGLDRLSKEFTKKMKVAIIYGAAHKSGVREYLENPRFRQTKLALYKPFRDIAPPEMTAYKYELDPEIASGKRKPQSIPESEWGYWKQTVQAPLY